MSFVEECIVPTFHRMPSLFIPHGGGPCFFMETPPGWPAGLWDRMEAYLRGIPASLERQPRAILIISAHWLTPRPTVHVAEKPTLFYDYYGFPEHTYHLTYPVTGAIDFAPRVQALLADAGFSPATESQRGLDHGVFIPLKVSYPEANIPVVQLSLQQDLNAAEHLAIGRALAPLRDEGVLIVGSGMSYHNLSHFGPGPGDEDAKQFDDWLTETLTAVEPAERERRLAEWESAPGARASHPTPEHLLPLMVAVGSAGDAPGTRDYSECMLGKAISGFRFG